MPFILVSIGILMVVVGYRGTEKDFLALLKGDFTGQGNFFYWIVSLFVVGAVGYIPRLKPISNAFLVLILLMLVISNKGFFAQFNRQVFNR